MSYRTCCVSKRGHKCEMTVVQGHKLQDLLKSVAVDSILDVHMDAQRGEPRDRHTKMIFLCKDDLALHLGRVMDRDHVEEFLDQLAKKNTTKLQHNPGHHQKLGRGHHIQHRHRRGDDPRSGPFYCSSVSTESDGESDGDSFSDASEPDLLLHEGPRWASGNAKTRSSKTTNSSLARLLNAEPRKPEPKPSSSQYRDRNSFSDASETDSLLHEGSRWASENAKSQSSKTTNKGRLGLLARLLNKEPQEPEPKPISSQHRRVPLPTSKMSPGHGFTGDGRVPYRSRVEANRRK